MKQGQAMVLVLLVTVVLVSVATLATALVTEGALSATRAQEGQRALAVAESAVEEGLLRTLRNPLYTVDGLVVAVPEGAVELTVTGSSTKVITATGTVGEFSRTVEAQVSFAAGEMTVTGWKEIWE